MTVCLRPVSAGWWWDGQSLLPVRLYGGEGALLALICYLLTPSPFPVRHALYVYNVRCIIHGGCVCVCVCIQDALPVRLALCTYGVSHREGCTVSRHQALVLGEGVSTPPTPPHTHTHLSRQETQSTPIIRFFPNRTI
jgi:hypothetical protein